MSKQIVTAPKSILNNLMFLKKDRILMNFYSYVVESKNKTKEG